jgi:hypothetical protein
MAICLLQPCYSVVSLDVGNTRSVLAYLFGSLVPNGAHSRGPSAVGLAKLKVAFR